MSNYESQLQEALKLSAETFKREQALREEALKLEQAMKRRQKANESKPSNPLVPCMKWQQLFVNRGVGSGLQNLGNSCFMNATLQCLTYTAPFAQLLCQSNHSSQCKSSDFCVLCEMEKIVPQMLMSKNTVKPRYLFKNIPKINDLLTPGCQEDAHEFLQSLLDKIEIAYDRKHKANNPIRKLFTGATKTCIQCARCKTKSITTEPFCCISLEVDDNVGLDEALEIFTQDELMRGADKYFCNKCNRKCIAHKRLTLSQIPPVLALHFKRFCVEFQANHHKQGITKKLSDHVEFPETFDFKNMKHLIFEEDQKDVLIDSEYELYAVLVHSGPQLGYGHYYALIKSPDGKHWFRMNDMQVIAVNLKHVLREQGYIVFYKRKTDTQMRQSQVAKEVHVTKNIKVDTELLTNDYFMNNCNDPTQDMVMVDGLDGNGKSDRCEYVKVPPMATRPAAELMMNQKKLNQDQEDIQEIFWPVKDLHDTE
eukprot:411699_1